MPPPPCPMPPLQLNNIASSHPDIISLLRFNETVEIQAIASNSDSEKLSNEDAYEELPSRTIGHHPHHHHPHHHHPQHNAPPPIENLQSQSRFRRMSVENIDVLSDPSTSQAFAMCQRRGRRRSSLAEVIDDWPLLEHTERPEFKIPEVTHLVHCQHLEVHS